MSELLFADVAAAAERAAATSARNAKRDVLATLFEVASATEAPIVVGLLVGAPRQGRIGVGWAQVRDVDADPAASPSLTVLDVDRALTEIAAESGQGSRGRRRDRLRALFGAATEAEQDHLARLLVGEMRHGALDGVVTDAVGAAHGVPMALVRRAAMFAGDLGAVAAAAVTDGRAGLEAFTLEVGRPVQPMLASTASSVEEAVSELGTASVEWKLDGIRLQIHKEGDRVLVVTRNLNDITDRVPTVVDAVRALEPSSLVLDGEMLWYAAGRPALFQDTAAHRDGPDARVGSEETVEGEAAGGGSAVEGELRASFFDLLHLDGVDLVDAPQAERAAALASAVPRDLRIPATVTDDPVEAAAVLAASLEAGHEGVVLKSVDSPYLAGRRGKSWRKVKPVHTFDLVVLAVEWGSGRRTGLLSNLHLGAASGDGEGFVMVGKTFKGMTDDLLAWQTERFTELAESRDAHLVRVRPEQVVEIAIDGVQRSTRYPGGVALRFARVVRYRHDKTAAEVDSIDTLRALL